MSSPKVQAEAECFVPYKCEITEQKIKYGASLSYLLSQYKLSVINAYLASRDYACYDATMLFYLDIEIADYLGCVTAFEEAGIRTEVCFLLQERYVISPSLALKGYSEFIDWLLPVGKLKTAMMGGLSA